MIRVRRKLGARGRRSCGLLCALTIVAVLASARTHAQSPTPTPQESAGAVEYLHVDALGSTRFVTDQHAQVISRHDYMPFGEEVPAASRDGIDGYAGPLIPATPRRFTGKERDTETGLDYLGARYYVSSAGRFAGADAPFADQEASDPQSWNLYTYTRNQPTTSVDVGGNFIATILGATLGAAVNAGIAAYEGRDVAAAAASGALSGALAGAVIDTGGAALGLYGAAAASGAAGAASGGALDRFAAGGSSTVGQVAQDATVGAATGVALAGFGKGVAGALARDLEPLASSGEHPLLQPGPFAGKSLPARGPARDFSASERATGNEIMAETGCHSCGTKTPGTKTGNAVLDHQPPNAVNPPGGQQRLYPQCLSCSRAQGLELARRTLAQKALERERPN